MLCFKLHQNRAINEEFYNWGGKIFSGGPKGGRVARFKKNRKILTQNDGFSKNFSILECQNFSILAELGDGVSISKICKKPPIE